MINKSTLPFPSYTYQKVFVKQALVKAPVPPLRVEKLKRIATVLHALERRHYTGLLACAAACCADAPCAARVGAALEERGEAERGTGGAVCVCRLLSPRCEQQVRE